MRGLGYVWLLTIALQTALGQPDTHYLLDALFCQPRSPASGLLKMFDDEQMFRYDFPHACAVPRISDFQAWAKRSVFPDPTQITQDVARCQNYREMLTTALGELMPEIKGILDMKIFPARPLEMGQPNTLICSVGNVYPPALTVTWRRNDEEEAREAGSSGYFAMPDLGFQTFSYLNVTPQYNDKYSCHVQEDAESTSSVTYWVPMYAVPSELMEDALCGLAFALGILFFILGCVFFFMAMKLNNTD
ncbi:class II histocompatibility antigen, M alpha chain [Ascaphus truei]|uniref:class II histocompatibility antigen, M alpha chain n=1 Tax=Ascaphus truei TaxID=8439 RepID=UPI003F5A15D0